MIDGTSAERCSGADQVVIDYFFPLRTVAHPTRLNAANRAEVGSGTDE